jgi:hypothetical protein
LLQLERAVGMEPLWSFQIQTASGVRVDHELWGSSAGGASSSLVGVPPTEKFRLQIEAG